jgi:hypothetical protein
MAGVQLVPQQCVASGEQRETSRIRGRNAPAIDSDSLLVLDAHVRYPTSLDRRFTVDSSQLTEKKAGDKLSPYSTITVAGGISTPEMIPGMNSPTYGRTLRFSGDQNEVSPDNPSV